MGALNVLLVAEEAAGVRALRLLVDGPHHPIAAITTPSDGSRGAGVAEAARAAGVPVWDPQTLGDPTLPAQIADGRVDLLLNVHSLELLPTNVVRAPRIGAFNLHPGPLPEYAGLSVPSWAIYNGETEHAVTLHRMVAEVDAGAVSYEARFPIGGDDTGLKVSATAVRLGMRLIGDLLEVAQSDPAAIPARAQDMSRRCYFRRAGPYGGRAPWRLPARRLVDFVRASDYSPLPSPWGNPVTRAAAGELAVVQVRATGMASDAVPGTVGEADDGDVRVAAADEWVSIQRIRVEEGAVEPTSFLRPGELLDPGPDPLAGLGPSI